MAAALSLTSARSNLLQYRWLCDGTGGANARRTQAQLIEDCAQRQPTLKSLLEAAQTDEAWLALNMTLQLAAIPVTASRRAILKPQFTASPEGGRDLEIVSDNKALGMAAIDVRIPG